MSMVAPPLQAHQPLNHYPSTPTSKIAVPEFTTVAACDPTVEFDPIIGEEFFVDNEEEEEAKHSEFMESWRTWIDKNKPFLPSAIYRKVAPNPPIDHHPRPSHCEENELEPAYHADMADDQDEEGGFLVPLVIGNNVDSIIHADAVTMIFTDTGCLISNANWHHLEFGKKEKADWKHEFFGCTLDHNISYIS